jgi:hypothetical protein
MNTAKSTYGVRTSRRFPLIVCLSVLLLAAFAGLTASPISAAGGCVFPDLSQPFHSFSDANSYFLAPGGSFEGGANGWAMTGGAGLAAGNEDLYVGSPTDQTSLAMPTKTTAVTTPTICVTSDAPTFRMFLKNNGNNGKNDGQLAVYLNFTGADGKAQQVKIAALTSKKPGWTLSPKISFIQYISTPLKSGYAEISFTFKPNDTHGNWQVDDVYVDPYKSG